MFVLAIRHFIEWEIGNDRQCVAKLLVELRAPLFARRNEVLDCAHLGFERLGARLVARLHGIADFLRRGIAPGLRVLQFLHMVAPFGIDFQQLGRHRRQAPAGQAPVESVRIVANGFDVVHGVIPFCRFL